MIVCSINFKCCTSILVDFSPVILIRWCDKHAITYFIDIIAMNYWIHAMRVNDKVIVYFYIALFYVHAQSASDIIIISPAALCRSPNKNSFSA